jgi:hypothetical protein
MSKEEEVEEEEEEDSGTAVANTGAFGAGRSRVTPMAFSPEGSKSIEATWVESATVEPPDSMA